MNNNSQIYSDTFDSISVKEQIEKSKIFIDTCSLMDDNFDRLIGNIGRWLIEYNQTLNIINHVNYELQKNQKSLDPLTSFKAARALNRIQMLEYLGLISKIRCYGKCSADSKFISQFTEIRTHSPVLLITQDNKLSQDIVSLNNLQSSYGYPVSVKRINAQGYLGEFRY